MLRALLAWISFCGAAAACAGGKEQDKPRDLGEFLASLASNDIERRESASRALRSAGVDALPQLGAFREATVDAEVRGRIDGIVAVICRDEAQKLYREGRLEECLNRLVQSEGETDLEKGVAARLSRVRKESQELVEPYRAIHQLKDIDDENSMVNAIVNRKFGPWIMPILLEDLGSTKPSRLPASLILKHLGKESSPYLHRAFSKGNSIAQTRVASLLVFSPELMAVETEATVKRMLSDPATNPSLRELLGKIPGARD